MTLALWKSAVFLEGSYKRRLAGTTDDPFFDLLEDGVPEIAERAWRIAQGSMTHDGLLDRLRRRPDDQRLRVVRARSAAPRGSTRTR